MFRGTRPRVPERCAFAHGLVLRRLLLLLPLLLPSSAAHRTTASPRIFSAALGKKRFQFDTTEKHIAVYHEQGSSVMLVGAENKLYYYNFENSTRHVESFLTKKEARCLKQEDATNYLTLIAKYQGKLLICGTGACNPTCWNWVDGKAEPGISGQSLAPFGLDKNALVLIDGDEIYSTIKKHQTNGRVLRFRRVRGSEELYTSDTVMSNPQFVKAAAIKQDKAFEDKIYYFFREDHPDWMKNPLAPREVSRVAQLCKGDKGGQGSLSAAKWTTFLKATLLCIDPTSGRHFDRLQDIFIVESGPWYQTKVYGLFSNEWNYSAICVFLIGDISRGFQISPLKGYSGKIPAVRPGQCLEGEELTPPETFKIVDSYPEVAHQMNGQTVFYSKHHYQQVGVHQVQAANGVTYSVLYLATDKGTIHKVVVLPQGAMNILEIQPFRSSSIILSMTLDHARNELFVTSANEVVQIPMATCGAYRNDCESCVLARDPYCGWANGKCTSIYEHGNGTLLQAINYDVPPEICASSNYSYFKEDCSESFKNVTVTPRSRHYLNCSEESHYANYTWYHNGQPVARCSSGHRHCIHFIDNMTDGLYGTYSCIAQEDWFNQTVVTEYLAKPSTGTEVRQTSSMGWASMPTLSFWLVLLHVIAVVLIIQ